MKKVVIKIMILMIVIFNFISFIPIHEVQASLWSDAQSWLSLGAGENPVASGFESAKTEVSQLAGTLFGIGLGLAFIALAALGISYFFASTSDAKSEIKQKTIIVLIGIFVVLGSLTIWRIIVGTLSSGT